MDGAHKFPGRTPFCSRMRSLRLFGGGRIAEISADCCWWRAGIDCALLGGLVDHGQDGASVPIWDADCEYDGLRHHRLLDELPGPAGGVKSSVAVPGARGVYWCLQHVFDIRMGDTVVLASRGVRDCDSVRCGKLCDRTCGGLGRDGAGGDGAVDRSWVGGRSLAWERTQKQVLLRLPHRTSRAAWPQAATFRMTLL